MDTPDDVCRFSEVSVAFGASPVIEHFTLAVPPASVTVVTGENGSGKTTLLKAAAGLVEPTAGTVYVKEREVDETQTWLRRAVAVVMDDMDFFPALTLAQNLELIARAHRVPRPGDLVARLLSEWGMEALASRSPRTLSSGQWQRLSVATAVVRPAELVILDEPEKRLHASGVLWIASVIKALRTGGASVLMASHSTQLVEAIGGCQLVHLGKGPDGTPEGP